MDTLATALEGLQTWAALEDALRLDLLVKLALATLLGGVIGWERETSGKPAGLRTNILICVGATLFTELSVSPAVVGVNGMTWDASRVPAQIVSGIGFLGAGTIMQAKGNVTGLTTAATLWVVAAIGMTVGAGAFFEATGTTLLVLVILWPMGWVEDRIEGRRRGRILRVVLKDVPGKVDELQQILEDAGMVVKLESVAKGREGEVQASFDVRGSSASFRRCRGEIMEMPEVQGVFRG
jgi:putative Mg2+ transporter-C (MgtC) family protein